MDMLRRFTLLVALSPSIVPSWAQSVRLDIAPSHKILHAEKTQTLFLKIGLNGMELNGHQRAPANIAIVLDKSGSMAGQKIEQAKRAAVMALERLGGQDIAAVIAYDDRIEVVQPATKVTDNRDIARSVMLIRPGGATALFAGVSKGAEEVRKFLSKNYINRVILLSDGQANVGPSTPAELGILGHAFSKEGISVTTIGLGLGYNEDLMVALARRSGGNHSFAENATDVARIFQTEFNDVLSVVAQDAQVQIRLAPGIKPVRVLGRDARISGQLVETEISQIYSRQEKFVMLEVEIPATSKGQTRPIASVNIQYNDMQKKTKASLDGTIAVGFSTEINEVNSAIDNNVMVAAVELIGVAENERAIQLRDSGKIQEAEAVMSKNSGWLRSNAVQYKSKRLESMADKNSKLAPKLRSPSDWGSLRKTLKEESYGVESQQKK